MTDFLLLSTGFVMTVAFVAYGNFRQIQKLFAEHPDEAASRCFKTILLSTSWRCCAAAMVLIIGVWLPAWVLGDTGLLWGRKSYYPKLSFGTLLGLGALMGAWSGFLLGLLPASIGSRVAKRGARATQIAVILASTVEVLVLLLLNIE